ncbi:MAG TPA: hypothetical protein VN655_18150 [Pseudolabrys sp.]|nr:hypothetical protein [Pseudolabrys sp.]
MNDDGRVVGRGTLPADFSIGEVAGGASAVRLIDKSGRRQMTIARNIDASATRALQAVPIMPDGTARATLASRRGPDFIQLREEGDTRAKPLDVRSVTGARLAQAYEIAPASNGQRYIVSEEIAAVAPAIAVRVFVRRYARSGEVTGIVHVPLDGFEVVPHDFITVGADGVVRVLAPTKTGVTIRQYEFTAPPRGGDGRRFGGQDLRGLGRSIRQVNVETQVSQSDPAEPSEQMPAANPVPVEVVLPPPPPITRAAILANARGFLTVNWPMGEENYARPGVSNVCQPRQGQIWLRPRHFGRETVGQTIGPMPYRWGGGDTPQTFLLRVEWGALAGNICTCRDPTLNYCIFADSAGTDCSGFISSAWGISKRGTSGLLDVADDLRDLSELRPGDAIDWPGHHVRLFVGMAGGAETAFNVIESTTRYPCEGVCEASYRPSELSGYRLLRFRGIREDAEARRR